MVKAGLIVNPIAGMGGRVGLKGTDGPEIVERARKLGAEPVSPSRTVRACCKLSRLENLELLAYSQKMGELEAKEAGLNPRILGSIPSGSTRSSHTVQAARAMAQRNLDLLLFAGGDGTARDIYDAVGQDQIVLGIPAGVKIQSGVFGRTPASAGKLAGAFLRGDVSRTRRGEVMDIDEEAYRKGSVRSKLFGYLIVPSQQNYVQSRKVGTSASESHIQQAIAEEVIEEMVSEYTYLIGPGSTTQPVLEKLGLDGTLLGVDAIKGNELLGEDLNESDLLKLTVEGQTRLIVTPIGGQGHLFGRGNQQISPRVLSHLRREEIIPVATPGKIASLGGKPLLVDTGDEETDRSLCGYFPLITGYREQVMYRVSR
ncbi:MAG: ATP-NAD kinase family protein [Candidatus Bipolaricaulota bacterium]